MPKPIRILILTSLAAIPLLAVPVQWTTGSGGNGHYYEYVPAVPGAYLVNQALTDQAANHKSFLGLPGYLVTITSQAEETFVFGLASGGDYWTGGTYTGSTNQWTWRGGPEAGQVFTYTHWSVGDPPVTSSNLVLAVTPVGACGTECWRIDGGGSAFGYMVEYSSLGPAAVPEPSSAMFLGSGLTVLVLLRRRAAAHRRLFRQDGGTATPARTPNPVSR